MIIWLPALTIFDGALELPLMSVPEVVVVAVAVVMVPPFIPLPLVVIRL